MHPSIQKSSLVNKKASNCTEYNYVKNMFLFCHKGHAHNSRDRNTTSLYGISKDCRDECFYSQGYCAEKSMSCGVLHNTYARFQ